MRLLLLTVLASSVSFAPGPWLAQAASPVPVKQFEVPWGREGRPRDPAVHPDGSIYFVGQEANYVARLDPRTGDFKKYAIEAGPIRIPVS